MQINETKRRDSSQLDKALTVTRARTYPPSSSLVLFALSTLESCPAEICGVQNTAVDQAKPQAARVAINMSIWISLFDFARSASAGTLIYLANNSGSRECGCVHIAIIFASLGFDDTNDTVGLILLDPTLLLFLCLSFPRSFAFSVVLSREERCKMRVITRSFSFLAKDRPSFAGLAAIPSQLTYAPGG